MLAELNDIGDPDFRVGISDKREGLESLSECYKQCVSALSASKIMDRRVLFYDNIGIYKLIYGVEDRNVLKDYACLLYTSPSPRDGATSRMPSSA